MNERIKEYWLKAAEQDRNEKAGWGKGISYDDCLEKFAYLIIKDCIYIADKRKAFEVMDDILENFGMVP